jgi:death-on-curing family protein
MLGAAYIERIHDVLVAKLWPGTDPIVDGEFRSIELIESAVGRPFHSAFERDAYPNPIDKSIALFHSLISNHPFYNGNKRTAVIAFDHFLMANGLFSAIDNREMYTLAERTASYRARGLSHEESFIEVRTAVADRIVILQALEDATTKNSKMKELYIEIERMRIFIRSDPNNTILPAEQN